MDQEFDPLQLSDIYAGHGNKAHALARALAHIHAMVAKSMASTDKRIAALSLLDRGLANAGSGPSPSKEVASAAQGVEAEDRCVQDMGAKALSQGLAALDLILQSQGVAPEERAELSRRGARVCVMGLPERAQAHWQAHLEKVSLFLDTAESDRPAGPAASRL